MALVTASGIVLYVWPSAILWFQPGRPEKTVSEPKAVIPAIARIDKADKPLVALDIGHTLTQPGAMSARGRPEFQFNRDLVQEINGLLKAQSFKTRVINPEGRSISLQDRAARSKDADFFLSIHHDSVKPQYLIPWDDHGTVRNHSENFKGFALFVSHLNSHYQESLKCASAIGESMRKAGFVPSKYHAESIAGESRTFLDKENGVHGYDHLIVLKKAEVPAVLLEAGVIVNLEEEQHLKDPALRKTMATAIKSGLMVCLAPSNR